MPKVNNRSSGADGGVLSKISWALYNHSAIPVYACTRKFANMNSFAATVCRYDKVSLIGFNFFAAKKAQAK